MKSILKCLSCPVVICGVSILLGGCGRTSQPTLNPVSQTVMTASSSVDSSSAPPTSSHQVVGSLREQLEATYASIRASFGEATPATYLSLINESDKTPDMVRKLQQNWTDPEIRQSIKESVFPDIATAQFVDVRRQGDYAAYYFISDPQDTNYLTIEVIRFHQTNAVWQMMQKRYSTSIPIGKSPEENRQKTLHEIETDPELGLMPPGNN